MTVPGVSSSITGNPALLRPRTRPNLPKLTKTHVDNLTASGDRDAWIWDSTLPGFGVRAQPSGRKTYVARYRTGNRTQRKLTVGRCSDLTPDQARELARRIFGRVAAGEDPAQDRRETLSAPDVAGMADRYMREHARPFKKPNSIRQDERNWRLYVLPAIGSKKVEAVTRGDVIAILGKLAHSPSTSNLTRALLSKAFNLAIEWEWRKSGNPCKGVKRHSIPQRETILTPGQLAAMDAAIGRLVDSGHISQPSANLFRLLALTGCRLREIMSARREWVDEGRRLLMLPDSKTGQRRINLPPKAIEIIRSMPPSEWLIPGPKAGPMQHPYRAWRLVLTEAGLPKTIRCHDLRHSFGSLGHRAGLSQRQIADMLGHANMATTARYLHGYTEDRTHAVDTVAGIITSNWQ